ncbi:Protein-lysine methyltransferase METTL21D [Vanrija pseudolonga]|uniref:Protein-lysine methyltransferase METTL21D n=1 Tax=Vanrija pseudolonga TaxID=143232 RepID=A0AAF1BKD8_9TREE|nr:Protein-lysine methyltransferase METTL21D [Vanrija pseudolonga]
MSAPHADPNFPPNLNIAPLHLAGTAATSESDGHGQAAAIARYGIAGRVWEATAALVQYLTPGASAAARFEPTCSLFDSAAGRPPHRVLELGSGQALASLHLASHLPPTDTIVLTDLPAVVPLCEASIAAWSAREGGEHAQVVARPLAWGEDAGEVLALGPFTHILMCDLVYFPHLYPPLLRTLLELTEPESIPTEGDTFGPEIIMAWKSRSLALEESFFDSFGRYFELTPVLGGGWDEERIFVCRRWRVTDEWRLPSLKHVMAPQPGVVVQRSFGLVDDLFAHLEWE